ncbi:Alpha-ketoglutarate-dependent dioxygenase alkB 7, mitochondrial [Mortierella alpina]|nr:Alpha-ketoglutarate-dependent dioxygenase alkB 7, mitochondrial [Mortierella alpina]
MSMPPLTGVHCIARASRAALLARIAAGSPLSRSACAVHWNARSRNECLVSTRAFTTPSLPRFSPLQPSSPLSTAPPTSVDPSGSDLGSLAYQQLCTPPSIASSHFDLSQIPTSERAQILRDFILVPGYLSPKEQEMLLAAATKKLKRALGKQVRYEDGHFDGVITRYRECSATDWAGAAFPAPIDKDKDIPLEAPLETASDSRQGQDRTSPSEVMQSIKQEFFPPSWKWVAPHILELEAGKGGIKPHVDHLDASGEVVAGLCLGSDAVMELIYEDDAQKQFRVLLPKGCFYFQRDSVRYHYKHGIPIELEDHQFKGKVIPKEKRISIMLRNALGPSVIGSRTGVPPEYKM